MQLPEKVKNELIMCQQKLRGAIGLHQKLYHKMKNNNYSIKEKREIREKLYNAQTLIKVLGRQQRPLIQRVRTDLDAYHERLKSSNKPVNYEADTANIAEQLAEHAKWHRNKSKSLLLPRADKPRNSTSTTIASAATNTSAANVANETSPTAVKCGTQSSCSDEPKKSVLIVQEPQEQENKERQPVKDPVKEDKPKSKLLLDRRSNLISALDKVSKQKSATPPANGTSSGVTTPVNSTPISRGQTPSPVAQYAPDTYHEPMDICDKPPAPGSKEHFLRYLGIVTHEQCASLVATRCERKKRMSISSAKFGFLYGQPENTPKRKKKLYLQQYTPPMTRKKSYGASNSNSAENTDVSANNSQNEPCKNNSVTSELPPVTVNKSPSPERSLSPIELPLTVKMEVAEDEICIVCRLSDEEAVNRCEHCGEYYHPSCHGPGPLYIQTRLCPYCARRSSSPETIKDKLRIKREQRKKLMEMNTNLKYEVRDLDLHASELTVKIKRQNFKRDQLLNEQRLIKNNLKTLLDFVSQMKGQLVKLDS